MRGASLRPVLEGKPAAWHDCIVTEMPGDRARLVRSARYKYVSYAGDEVDLLFDMQSDPGETKNLAGDARFAPVAAEHRKLLKEWERRLDPVPDVPNADAWWRKA